MVLRQAGLPMGLLNREKILVTTEELFSLYRGIAEVSRDPAIGLKLGTEDQIERYDPIAIAVLCTRSFRDALRRMARYKQLTCPEKIDLLERENECAVHFTWLLAHEEEPTMLVDTCFGWMIAIVRRGTGRPIRPKRVEFQRAPAYRETYEAHFGCPVKFKTPRNALVFSKADMDGPFLTYNADLLAMVAPQLEAELRQQLAEKNLREQVKGVLKRLLAGRRPGIQEVAPGAPRERAYSAAPPCPRGRNLPAIDGGCSPRIGTSLPSALLLWFVSADSSVNVKVSGFVNRLAQGNSTGPRESQKAFLVRTVDWPSLRDSVRKAVSFSGTHLWLSPRPRRQFPG
jgi:hypothetical protein